MDYARIVSFDHDYMIVTNAADGLDYKLTKGTLAWRNNNPGNLKYGEFARDFGALGIGGGGHAVFATFADGAAAQKALLFSDEGNPKTGTYYDLSIRDAIAKYAPVDDPNPIAKNDPPAYAAYVAEEAGVSVDTILKDLSDSQQDALLKAMRFFEGWKAGTIEAVEDENA